MPPSITDFDLTVNTAFNSLEVDSADCDRVEIWRKFAANNLGHPTVWQRLTKTLASGNNQVFTDYGAVNDLVASYFAKAIDDATGDEAVSAELSGAQAFGGMYVHKAARGGTSTKSGSLYQLNNLEGGRRQISLASELHLMPALSKPVIDVSLIAETVWGVPLLVTDDGVREQINTWIEEQDVICLRDDRGRRLFGLFRQAKQRRGITTDYPVELTEVSFREHIR